MYVYENFNKNRFIEHLNYPLSNFMESLKVLQFREKKRLGHFFNYIAFCNVTKYGPIRGFDLIIDENIEVLNRCKFLCTFLSNRLRTKFLFKIVLLNILLILDFIRLLLGIKF